MDFSADGSDSWDSTPTQEKFIQSYFRGKEPQSTSVTKFPKKRKKHILSSDMPSTSIILKQKTSLPVVTQKCSTIKSEKNSVAKQFSASKSSSAKSNSSLNLAKIDTGSNNQTKNYPKKTTKNDCPTSVVSDNFEKTKKSKKRSLKNKCEPNDFTKECLYNASRNNYSSKSSFPKDNNPSIKKKQKNGKTNICQTSQTQGKLCEIEAGFKIKKMKDTENILDPKENFPDTDESGNSDDDEVIRNELQNTVVFKKIQKLMKLSPHLNPNFTEDMKANDSSCEEVSVENWSSDKDEDLSDSEVEMDEDLSDSEVEVTKGDHKNLPESSSESEAKDLSHKKTSYLSQSDSSPVQKKLKKSLSNTSSNDSKINETNSQISKEMLETSNSLSTNENPSKLKANENVKRSSSFMEKTRAKLAAAKFRFLNEKLYTESGGEAFKYFQKNREEFEDYHLGYGLQVSKWPLNPVDEIISDLQKSKKDVVIADMGCGDAKIARVLTNKKVYSFDLVAMHECVTACNISRVPLPDCNVDVVVFCLSLMGINLVDYLQEAYRILKIGGSLKIAEVESRIENLDLFIKNLNSLGFALEKKNTKNKLFVFLDLKKVKKGKGSKVPTITLRPCLYKKR